MSKQLYDEGHLAVAAIRILTHLDKTPPTVAKVADCLSVSEEKAHFTISRLKALEIIRTVEGPYGDRLFITDHTKLESIDRNEKESGISEELKQFQTKQAAKFAEIENIKNKQEQERKAKFAEIEKQLQAKLKK